MRPNCGQFKLYSSNLSILRLFNPKIPDTAPKNSLPLIQARFYGKYSGYGHRIGHWIKQQHLQVARACTKQFEFIVAQRIRRSLQLFHLYTRIWDELALKEFMKSWRQRVGKNTKEFLASAVGVTMFNWDQERITDNEVDSYSKEIENIHSLRDSTVVCRDCHLRLVIDSKQSDVDYCTCEGSKAAIGSVNDNNDWQPFIERQDMLIWRREEPNSGGLYAYKIFGTFSDVTAQEFLQVQVDMEYRRVWDSTAKELEIIDTDPKSNLNSNDRTDVVYWEMIWPRLFSNRDYVYKRRWIIDEDKGIVVIVSRVTDHPNAPKRPDTYRVTSYWSYMVIKPCTSFDEPGIEFGLTYFDDAGVNMPSAVTAWVAMNGLPDFLCRMREAAKEYKKYLASKEETNEEKIETIMVNDKEATQEQIITKIPSIDPVQNQETVSIELRAEDPGKETEPLINNNDIENINFEGGESVNDKELQSEEKKHGFLRYYFLTKLFA